MQLLDDKKKKKRNCLKLTKILQKWWSCTFLVQLVYLPYTISITPLYNDINFIHMHKLCPHECVYCASNGLTFKLIKTNKMLFYLFSMQSIIKNKTKIYLKTAI